jgi:hypothetical protein
MPLIKASTNRDRICASQLPDAGTDPGHVGAHARFIGDTADYVLNQVIESTLGEDRDFPACRAAQGPGAITPSERDSHGRGSPRRGSPALSRA